MRTTTLTLSASPSKSDLMKRQGVIKNAICLFAICSLISASIGVLHSQPMHSRIDGDFKTRPDTFAVGSLAHRFPNGRNTSQQTQTNLSPGRKVVFPDSPIFVIDTAIVRSSWDTTRHAYLFNTFGKRTSDLTQVLRGTLWLDTLRHTNTYDASSNMLIDLYEYYSNNQWVGQSRKTYVYDAKNNMLSDVYQGFSDGEWRIMQDESWTYDANGNTLTDLDEWWSEGQLTSASRNTNTYDAGGNQLSLVSEYWSNDQWTPGIRRTWTYDPHGNILSHVWEEYHNGQWTNSDRDSYTYDANNFMLTELRENWTNGQWQNSYQVFYGHRADGNLDTVISLSWENGMWVNSTRQTNTYDAYGHLLSWLVERWSSSGWLPEVQGTSTYDSNGRLTLHVYRFWTDGACKDIDKDTYTYDPEGRLIIEMHEQPNVGTAQRYLFGYSPEGNLTSICHQNLDSSSWRSTDIPGRQGPGFYFITDSAGNSYAYCGYSFDLVYGQIATGVMPDRGVAPSTFSLSQNYPNPFNPTTAISYQLSAASLVSLKVCNVLGQDVTTLVNEKQTPGTYTVHFDGSKLASGVYFYRLDAGSFTQTRKMLLIK